MSFNSERDLKINLSWLILKLVNVKTNSIYSNLNNFHWNVKLIIKILIVEDLYLTSKVNLDIVIYYAQTYYTTNFWRSSALRTAPTLTITSKRIIIRPSFELPGAISAHTILISLSNNH